MYFCSGIITILKQLVHKKLSCVLMRCLIAALVMASLTMCCQVAVAQDDSTVINVAANSPDSLTTDTAMPTVEELIGEEDVAAIQSMAEGGSLHEQLKTKYVDGSAGFMSLVALALVIGLTLCIERIIYLTLAEVNAKKLLADIEKKMDSGDVEGAKTLCRETRGPVASICYQGLMHADEDMATVERSIVSYGTVQSGLLEKGCSWIRLMIAIAPSMGFLGTVIGMVMAFDQIQEEGDIGPTIVASGMKVALITTIFGIIVALVLQIFYNFILSKIERLTTQMEESAIDLLDIMSKSRSKVCE